MEDEKRNELIDLFGEDFICTPINYYEQTKLRTDREMFRYLKQFITLEELPRTNYKHKLGYYKKKGHYINGKKVNRYIYNYVKKWLETI